MSYQTHSLHATPTRSKWALHYLAFTAALNLVWEMVHLPLYTLWNESSPSAIAFAVFHCTLGDVLIAASALAAALVLVGSKRWPGERFLRVALVAGALGVTYTVFSEWNNTVVTRTWAYSNLMPMLWGIGLSPVAQWLLIPGLVFWRLKPNAKSGGTPL